MTGAGPVILVVEPAAALEGGVIALLGERLTGGGFPRVRIGGAPTRPTIATPTRLLLPVPPDTKSGRVTVETEAGTAEGGSLTVGLRLAGDLHPVAGPAVASDGTIWTTVSGSRGQEIPAPLVKIGPDGRRETFTPGPLNPTGLSLKPDGTLFFTSRHDGTLYRFREKGSAEPVATDLGTATGLAADREGALYVGDREGTVFRISPAGTVHPFCRIPPSVAAFHLAWGPDDALYVTAPTLSNEDPIYRIDADGSAAAHAGPFERPQGLAFDAAGRLFVVAGQGGRRGIFLVEGKGLARRVVAGANLVGLAFGPGGDCLITSTWALYRLPASALP
jgi:sugar lactone lactonase YvrE